MSGILVRHLFVSPGHNFRGHHGGPPGTHAIDSVAAIECVAGRGIRGDRYFDFAADFKGQVTFFAEETYTALCERFGRWDRPCSVFRRNVVTRGVDLELLIGRPFEVQGVRFEGTESCRPCHWMNGAFHPGTEAALAGRGGLRARILSDGWLRVDAGQ